MFIVSVAVLAFFAGITAGYFEHPSARLVLNTIHAIEVEKAELPKISIDQKESDQMMAGKRVFWDAEQANNGLTLVTLRYSSTAYLVNMKGNIVYRWDLPFYNFWPHPDHVPSKLPNEWIYLEKAIAFPNGDLIATYTASGVTPYGYGMVKVDKNSRLIWKYSQNTHHDFSIDPETGNIYALIHTFQHNSAYTQWSNVGMLEDFAVKLSPNGVELQRISILEAFRHSPYAALLDGYNKNRMRWDRLHTNSIAAITPTMASQFPMFKAGQLFISLRNLNSLAVLDPDTQSITWAFNGIWRAQHSPQLLPNGHILLFDNKGRIDKGHVYSRVLEFDPQTLGIIWNYDGNKANNFYTDAFGRVQRLANGNTLVAEAMKGRIFELTPDKKIVWNFELPMVRRILDKNAPQPVEATNTMDDDTEEPLLFDSSLSGIIVSAARYNESELPFLDQHTMQ